MLEHFFKNPGEIQRLRCNPLGPHLDSFLKLLLELGYADSTVRGQVLVLAEFGRWVKHHDIALIDLDEQVVECFLDECGRCNNFHKGYPAPIRRFLEHLRVKGIIPFPQPVYEPSPTIQLQSHYENCLRVGLRVREVYGRGFGGLP